MDTTPVNYFAEVFGHDMVINIKLRAQHFLQFYLKKIMSIGGILGEKSECI